MKVPSWLEPLLRWGLWLFRPKYLIGVFPICINEKGEVLLIEKRLGAATGIQLPGGAKEYGVPLADSAVEELIGETGLAAYPSACEQLPIQCIERHRDVNVPFLVLRWHGELGPRDTREIACAMWVPYQDAMAILYPLHKPMLEEAYRRWAVHRYRFP
jgi:8-oxo-dGTP pyrophosphatase MutT (NUDIX family)